MKLAAIYNVFDGVELLHGSIKCISEHVDYLIIVYQKFSNYGEEFDGFEKIDLSEFNEKMVQIQYVPTTFGGAINEKQKRNIGLDMARQLKCTHFLHMDCDEYYVPDEFAAAKEHIIQNKIIGSVCRMFTYFKKPTWRTEYVDNYFVPFIHRLKLETVAGGSSYPYYVDPTRRINETLIDQIPTIMHHFSWVRQDINLKIRNSSAKSNILKSNMLEQYHSDELELDPEGFFVDGFGQKLTVVDNRFNINISK